MNKSLDEKIIQVCNMFSANCSSSEFLTIALAGEVGEFANLIEKIMCYDSVNLMDLKYELCDIYIYLRALMHKFDVTDEIIIEKLNIVERRLKDGKEKREIPTVKN